MNASDNNDIEMKEPLISCKVAGLLYETDSHELINAAKHCGPGTARKIAEREGKIWRRARANASNRRNLL